MKPIMANQFLEWLQGEMDAFCSILQLNEAEAVSLIDNEQKLDSVRNRLASYLIENHPAPVNSADALLLALERAETRLQAMIQTATSLAPMLEL